MTDIEWAISRFERLVRFKSEDKDCDAWRQAIEALREKRDREKGCEYCNEDTDGYATMIGTRFYIEGNKLCLRRSNIAPREINFCPMCGRKLMGGKDDE